jgi:hypothetical protein
MRKTTIFRSSSLVVLCAAVASAGATAQEPDTLQLPQRPDVHIVVAGETLWDLAQRYLDDPFLWPEIYRLNTLVVEDPHWIFPGEELRLGPLDTTMVGETVVVGQPVVGDPDVDVSPQVEQAVLPDQPVEDVLVPDMPPPGAPPPPPPGFLTEGQDLPWGKVLRAVGKPTLSSLSATSSTLIYGEVAIEAPRDAMYQLGDSLLMAKLTRDVPGWGKIVHPTGIAVVTQVTDDGGRAQIVQQFDRVSDGQVAIPLEPFRDPGMVVPVPLDNGLMGAIVEIRDPRVIPGQQDILFIDRGREDGVALGDVFTVLRPGQREGIAPDTVGYMQIVHTRDQSSSGLLIIINDLGIGVGAPVQLFAKMPT